jgi:hypothetical protein
MPKFISNSFVAGQSAQYNLSIQTDLNGFCFYISHSNGNCLALKNYTYTAADYNELDHELHDIFEQEPLLKLSYKRCFCLFLSNKSTLIPTTLFAPEHLRTYLEFVVPLDELDEIHYKALPTLGATDVFTVPGPLANIVHMYHQQVEFFHQSIPLIRLLQEQQPQHGILLHLNHAQASLAVVSDGRLVLSNTFPIETFTDALYYMAYVSKQWKMDPANTTVYLSDNLHADDMKVLRRYYANIQILFHKGIAEALGRATGVEYQLLPQLCACE